MITVKWLLHVNYNNIVTMNVMAAKLMYNGVSSNHYTKREQQVKFCGDWRGNLIGGGGELLEVTNTVPKLPSATPRTAHELAFVY